MQLKGLSASTQEGYLNAVRQLAGHYHLSPDELSEEDLRQYFLYLANEKKVARSTATVAICGIKFLYQQTLQRQWSTFRLVRPPRAKKLPAVLSREEVRRSLAAVRIPAYRACLTTIYACGLRANEGAHLQGTAITPNAESRAAWARRRISAYCWSDSTYTCPMLLPGMMS